MQNLLSVALGGALGSALRYWLSTQMHQWLGRGFPYGTLLVNVLGCLLMGFLAFFMTERLNLNPVWRAAMLIGFLGGLTTFSSFSQETLNLLLAQAYLKAALNVLLNLSVCLGATMLGLWLARQL